MHKGLLTAFLLGALGVGTAWAQQSAAPVKFDPDQIAKLIEQLGSKRFKEREDASRELEKIGVPALAALQKALQSNDMETRKRAEDLVEKLNKLAETEKLLAPTKVRLTFKDTPLLEAVEEIRKQTGFQIQVAVSAQSRDKKITLDTGETTFWKAMDQFCEKAGLVETAVRTTPVPRLLDSTPVQIQIQPIRVQPAQPKPVPPPAPPAPAKPVQAPPAAVQRVVAAVQVQAQPQPANAAQAAVMTKLASPQVARPGETILLTEGKTQAVPTDYVGAIRIRAVPADPKTMPAIGDGEIAVALQVTPEPRMQLVGFIGVRIDKALDDKGQNLSQAMLVGEAAPRELPLDNGLVARVALVPARNTTLLLPVRLKKGEKEAQTIKELAGTVQVQIRTAPEALITVDDILKASGKMVKGADGCSLKIIDIAKQDNGTIKVQLELVRSRDILPTTGPVVANPIQPAPGGVNPIQPAPRVRYPSGYLGLRLLDGKDNELLLDSTLNVRSTVSNTVYTQTATLVYQAPQGGAEPAKFTFTGTRTVPVDVPFALKDVPVK